MLRSVLLAGAASPFSQLRVRPRLSPLRPGRPAAVALRRDAGARLQPPCGPYPGLIITRSPEPRGRAVCTSSSLGAELARELGRRSARPSRASRSSATSFGPPLCPCFALQGARVRVSDRGIVSLDASNTTSTMRRHSRSPRPDRVLACPPLLSARRPSAEGNARFEEPRRVRTKGCTRQPSSPRLAADERSPHATTRHSDRRQVGGPRRRQLRKTDDLRIAASSFPVISAPGRRTRGPEVRSLARSGTDSHTAGDADVALASPMYGDTR